MASEDTNQTPQEASSPQITVVLRTYTTVSDAESAAAALKAAGFECALSSDDCGGMFPTLDAACGIQLSVRSCDAPAALAYLAAPTEEPNPDTSPTPEAAAAHPPARFPLLPFITGLGVGVLLCLLYQWADKLGTKKYRRDLNGDGRPDEVWVYVNNHLSESSIDRNFDGIVDAWNYFDPAGKQTLAKADNNFDTIPDVTWTYTNGVLASSHSDTDFNAIPDVICVFTNELPTRVDWQPNGTNLVMLRQIFRNGVLVEESHDTNMDGIFDVTTHFDAFQNPIRTNAFKLLSPASQ